MVDALSTPPKANAIVDQKITSFRSVLGTNEAAGMGVAEPYRDHESHPRTTSAPAGIQLAIAPTLFSHFPTFRPTTLRVTVRTSPAIATAMKKVLLLDNACHDDPPTNSTLLAAKYSRLGKYGRFDPQYVQPVMKPANGPNARLLHT